METIVGSVITLIILMYWLFLVFGLVWASGIYARRLNRSVFWWVICSLLFSPVITFAFLLALGTKKGKEQSEEPVVQNEYSDEQCPQCGAELNGVVCPSCKHWVG